MHALDDAMMIFALNSAMIVYARLTPNNAKLMQMTYMSLDT